MNTVRFHAPESLKFFKEVSLNQSLSKQQQQQMSQHQNAMLKSVESNSKNTQTKTVLENIDEKFENKIQRPQNSEVFTVTKQQQSDKSLGEGKDKKQEGSSYAQPIFIPDDLEEVQNNLEKHFKQPNQQLYMRVALRRNKVLIRTQSLETSGSTAQDQQSSPTMQRLSQIKFSNGGKDFRQADTNHNKQHDNQTFQVLPIPQELDEQLEGEDDDGGASGGNLDSNKTQKKEDCDQQTSFDEVSAEQSISEQIKSSHLISHTRNKELGLRASRDDFQTTKKSLILHANFEEFIVNQTNSPSNYDKGAETAKFQNTNKVDD